MKTFKNLFILITLLFFTSSSYAADVTVEMLNKLGKESMVYSEKVVRVDVGDTVFWKSTNPGHNVEFSKVECHKALISLKLNLAKMHNILLKFLAFMLTGAHLIKAWV